MKFLILVMFLMAACKNPVKRSEEAKTPTNLKDEVNQRSEAYDAHSLGQYDDFGMLRLGGSVGDSALFTCLNYAATGNLDGLDLEAYFVGGKPIRHPEISPEISAAPISRDMVLGLLYCLWVNPDIDQSRSILKEVIAYGRSSKFRAIWMQGQTFKIMNTETDSWDLYLFDDVLEATVGTSIAWNFCSGEDVDNYKIDKETFIGRCIMSPTLIGTTYDLYAKLGGECDTECNLSRKIFIQLPSNATGFRRHLFFVHSLLRGILKGVSEIDLKGLKDGTKNQDRNALFHAVYRTFEDGDQTNAVAALSQESLFPLDSVPNSGNYCAHYLFQRDQNSDDWRPCVNDHPKTLTDWRFAKAVAFGQLKGLKGD